MAKNKNRSLEDNRMEKTKKECSKMLLNITNGDAFNEYLLSKVGGAAVPFREAMMDGDAVLDIFSDEFISLRASELNVSADEYRANVPAGIENYSELVLWFGKDTFCQINLLTLLAYLEQINYSGRVVLNYIDDETFCVLDKDIKVELGLYRKMYEDILISKIMPQSFGVLVPFAIELYFDYHSDNGALARMVRENSSKDDMALICLLLENSRDYGLSDIEAQGLIKRYKQSCDNR